MNETLLIILALLLLIIGYLLFAPIRIAFDLRFGVRVSAVSTVRMFPFHYTFDFGKPKEKPGKPEKPKPEKPEKKQKKAESQFEEKRKFEFSKLNRGDIGLIVKTLGEVFRFLGRLIKAPDRYFVQAELSGGVPEPDTTGILYGAYQAVRPVLPRGVALTYKPDFLAEKIDGTVSFGLVVRIITVLKEFSLFVFRLPIIRLIKLYRKL